MLSRNELPPTHILDWLLAHHFGRQCRMSLAERSGTPSRGPVKAGSPWSAPVQLEGVPSPHCHSRARLSW